MNKTKNMINIKHMMRKLKVLNEYSTLTSGRETHLVKITNAFLAPPKCSVLGGANHVNPLFGGQKRHRLVTQFLSFWGLKKQQHKVKDSDCNFSSRAIVIDRSTVAPHLSDTQLTLWETDFPFSIQIWFIIPPKKAVTESVYLPKQRACAETSSLHPLLRSQKPVPYSCLQVPDIDPFPLGFFYSRKSCCSCGIVGLYVAHKGGISGCRGGKK